MRSTNNRWINSSITTYPVTEATKSQQHFTTGSRISAGHDDDSIEAGLRVNDLFTARPALVIGQIGMVRLNNLLWQAVTPPTEQTVTALLAEMLAAELPTNLFQPRRAAAPTASAKASISTSPRAVALMRVYTAAKELLKADAAGADATALRDTLNVTYDALVRQYGVIHTRANQQVLKGQPELYFLRALETNVREEAGMLVAEKSAIFYGPTVRPTPTVAIGRMTPDEAFLRCLNDIGKIDLTTIATYAGRSESDVINALQGRIYCDPATQAWVTADAYLSGNVRKKLAVAEEAANADPSFIPNVISLQAVQPIELTPGQIDANLGASWIPASDVRDFIVSIIPCFAGDRSCTGDVQYIAPLAKWVVKDTNFAKHSPEATSEWGTARMDGIAIIEAALNGVPPVVTDAVGTGDSKKYVPNQKDTLLVQEKWQQLAARFSAWIWEDADRAERLCRVYNDTFNSIRRRDFDGSHLALPGINRAILRGEDLLPHQKDGVWCALQQNATLFDLCVGSGKTFMGLVWAHEVIRVGMAKKVLIDVPNHLVEQWGVEANRLYPDMRVLVMSPEDFTKARRGEFLSRIATENFDVVICAHTSFGFIEAGQCARDFINVEVGKLRDYLKEARANKDADKRSLKQIEDKILTMETRLRELEHGLNHDSDRIITWDELGIDALFVDEAHEFKNLYTPSMMNVPGVPNGDAKRAMDMRIKTWDIRTRGGKVVFATGTPILNSVGEAFIMQTFLAEELLAERGIAMFDAWARTFAKVVPVFEMTPDGGGFRVNSRLARFVNMPELFGMWFQFTFSRSREQLGLPTPALMGGKRIGVSIPASPRLTAFVKDCVERVEAIKAGDVKPWEDNMLCVVNDAGKAALDTRLVMGGVRVADVEEINDEADEAA